MNKVKDKIQKLSSRVADRLPEGEGDMIPRTELEDRNFARLLVNAPIEALTDDISEVKAQGNE